MKKSSFLAWIYRMPLIQRWGLMHCFKSENIAEHSHQVSVNAHLLILIKNKHFGGDLDPGHAALLGIYHESSETRLTDIVSPTKYDNPEFTRQFKELEAITEKDCVNSLPEEFKSELEPLIIQSKINEEYKNLLKAADLLAAYIKTIDELRYGNSEFKQVKINLENKLDAIKTNLPEVEYFINTFIDDCGLTLDKLVESSKKTI